MKITIADMDEIIAIQFSNIIYFGQAAIDKAMALKDFTNIHSRAIFKFMAVLDLDSKWEEYLTYPTLFKLSELKEYCEQQAK